MQFQLFRRPKCAIVLRAGHSKVSGVSKLDTHSRQGGVVAICLALLLTSGFGLSAKAAGGAAPESIPQFSTRSFRVNADCDIRVGVQPIAGGVKARGDILFLPGFGDRLDNHEALFEEWAKAGFRVISFDYPGHGESRCDRLDFFDPARLASLGANIEKSTRGEKPRPLILAGFSFGGLLATRMSQGLGALERKPTGLILISPWIALPRMIGGDGFVREKTLSRNTELPHEGEPTPRSPTYFPFFSGGVLEELRGFLSPTPLAQPTLVLLGGAKEDQYIKVDAVQGWVMAERALGSSLEGSQCAGGFHELDNEPEPMGGEVRALTVQFAVTVVEKSDKPFQPKNIKACAPF